MSNFVNRRDLEFHLYEVFGLQDLFATPRYSNYDRVGIDAVLDSAEEIAKTSFQPSAAKLDANEPRFEQGRAVLIPEVSAGLAAHREAGFFGASFDLELGGSQLPMTISTILGGIFFAANAGIAGYPFLTVGAAHLIETCGSAEQKARFLGPMIEGRFFGTMALSEPQAGSSLADIRTRAEPLNDGWYRISGTKMWISGGDHDLSENIIHMVLAKIPGGPAGVKGISLFIVPKYRVAEDGSVGESNNIVLAGLNHKMGQRGTTNTLLNFGETGECRGWLVGEPHKGLQYMFNMMNEARIGVGYCAAMSGLAGYLSSLSYAPERIQGRRLDDKGADAQPVAIIEHPDVRRLLMAQKAYVEGAIGLLIYCSMLVDRQKTATDAAEAKRLGRLLDILTPVAKSWPSEFCLEANKHAIQVLGGAGYTRDFPVERYYRDNRLNHIHEGTHAIHGLDLLGRKVRQESGAALSALADEIGATIAMAGQVAGLADLSVSLSAALNALQSATKTVAERGDPAVALANATPYLDAFGHVVVAWIWLEQAVVASHALARGDGTDVEFYNGKLAACRFFYRYELPRAHLLFGYASGEDDTFLPARPEHFVGV